MKKEDGILVPHEKPFQYQEGGYTVTRGSAWSGPGCHNGCGVLLYTDKDNKLVKVEGDPENPKTEGRLCVRCLAVPEVVYHQDRLTYPMKRAKEDRGKDKWERITWEEAYEIIEVEFNKIRKKYGPEGVCFIHGTGRDIAPYQSRLSWSFGSPNYANVLSGNACYLPRVAGCAATTGSFWLADCSQQFSDRYENPEWKLPETMFIWGNNPIIANADGFFGHWVIDMMRRGMKIVVVDPRVTWLSSRSEIHLPVRPGTDAALALGMLNVIINEELYDHDFVDRWCYGFDELRERVQDYPVEKVADITWVPAEKIVEAARLLATSEPATLQWGLAVDMTKEAIPAGQAIIALFQVTGNIDIPGGLVKPAEIMPYSAGWGRDLMPEEMEEKRLGVAQYNLFKMGFKQSSPDVLIETLETDDPYPIKGAWLQTVNFLACMAAEPERAFKAFDNCDFIAYVDLFMTPTCMALADVCLPAATFTERAGVCVGDGTQQGAVINKVIEVGECRPDTQICLEVGKLFNPEAWPWDTPEEMISALIAGTGYTYEELQKDAPVYLPFEYRNHEKGNNRKDGTPGFQTASGRIELWSTFYNAAGLDPLPYFSEPDPGPNSTPELFEQYPLVLTTGARNWFMFHSEHRQIKRLRAGHPDPLVEVHPEKLEELGINDGDWVWIENQNGKCKMKVKATTILSDPRIVSADHAWWRPEADPENLYDTKEININNLMVYGSGKSGFGSNYKTSICKIYKVKDGE